jgi:hypothetical protein
MVVVAVPVGKFFARQNIPKSIELDVMQDDPHISVGAARVIDVAKRITVHGSVYRKAIIEFDNCQSPFAPNFATNSPLGHHGSSKLAYLRSGRNRLLGE